MSAEDLELVQGDASVGARTWRPTPRQLVWTTVGALALSGVLVGIARAISKPPPKEENDKLPPKGRPVCPVSPAPTAGLQVGDYVILTLADRGGVFREMAWAQVMSRAPEGDKFLVRLLGTTGPTGPVDLAKKRHGYRIGDEVKIEADCVWDTMHAPDVGGKGQLYCGFVGAELVEAEPVSTVGLQTGDEVQIVVSTIIGNQAHAERLWTKVDGISRTGSVVYGTILDPVHFPMHGFRRWQQIEFGRDCIFGWRRP